ncbi:hypothetical protein TNCV_3071801 [Trichonephila clavipes]|nr:hypothetical protein TNCV_3071801 [Trichonephila clavipes]
MIENWVTSSESLRSIDISFSPGGTKAYQHHHRSIGHQLPICSSKMKLTWHYSQHFAMFPLIAIIIEIAIDTSLKEALSVPGSNNMRILSDSRSAIQHLSKRHKVGDYTGVMSEKCFVKAEMKKRVTYKPCVQIRTTCQVISATCTCPARGTPALCKHVFALLHGINDYIAKKLYEALNFFRSHFFI